MVGTTKRCLRKVVGRFQVSEEGLNTILVAIEAAIKPIVQAEDESGALTPAHFLVGERLVTVVTEQWFLESRKQQLDFELLIKLIFGFKVIILQSFKWQGIVWKCYCVLGGFLFLHTQLTQ